MTTITQYFHFPNNTELGKGNTHECYLLVPHCYDLTNIFPPGKEIEVTETHSSKKYYLKSSQGREFRINQMGLFYRDHDVHMGDEIIVTHVEGIYSCTYIEISRHKRVVIRQSHNGAEIVNIERLSPNKRGELYEIPIIWNGQELSMTIQFKKALAKRNDSPDLTDYYIVKVGNNVLQNGSYLLTLDKQNELSTYEKTSFRTFPFDETIINSSGVTNKKKEPFSQISNSISPSYIPFLTALRTKPFMLLAGISGTGKSRIAREIARACWNTNDPNYTAQVPENFCIIQVKPNWHDSTELLGYVSRVGETPHYVAGDFLPFIAKAWEHPNVPYILCLDEMNLAPVEQYLAEYLSVIESRRVQNNQSNHSGKNTITTDPLLKPVAEQWYYDLVQQITYDENISSQFKKKGISIPQNLFVIGTVNMDETTFSFSRKVLDRAMTIEMNKVDLYGGLTETENNNLGYIGNDIIGDMAEGKDVYADYQDICDEVLNYLKKVNEVLEGTPFKIAYRTRNEFLLYAVNRKFFASESQIWQALDEMTSMKILSRIEGDDTKVSDDFLDRLSKTIEDELKTISGEENTIVSISLAKLKEMKAKLASGYTSFWS